MNRAKELGQSLLSLLFPRSCAVCGTASGNDEGSVCWDCRVTFESIKHPFCSLCGDPVDGMIEHSYLCSMCRRKAPSFDRARSCLMFRGGVKSLLHSFKYESAVDLLPDLSLILFSGLSAHYPNDTFDGICGVPLFSRKQRERGYNQADLLARNLSVSVGVDFMGGAVRRVRDTESQTLYSASERRFNVKGAFNVSDHKWVDGRRILLVDDVMTTGATVNEVASVLKGSGAISVSILTVARG